jgi:hypothetical protein
MAAAETTKKQHSHTRNTADTKTTSLPKHRILFMLVFQGVGCFYMKLKKEFRLISRFPTQRREVAKPKSISGSP